MNFPITTLFKSTIIFIAMILVISQCKHPNSNDEANSSDTAIDTSEVLNIAAIAPRFPGCEELSSNEEKKKCSDKKLLEYIYAHIQYPAYAKEHGVQGRCVVSFIVEKDGKLTNSKIIKDIGGGCGEASLAVVHGMSDPEFIRTQGRWIAGVDHGVVARVLYYMPVNFRLEEKVVE